MFSVEIHALCVMILTLTIREVVLVSIHEELMAQFETYVAESSRFEKKGIKASAARARKALAEISKLCKERRKEIQESKTAEDN